MYVHLAMWWAITIAGIVAIPAPACVVLSGGAERAGLGRRRAALLPGARPRARQVVHRERGDRGSRLVPARLGHGVPWMPVAVVGFFGALLALRQIPAVARALPAPAWRAA